jgi:gliding motility-associated-like protein
VKKTIRTPSKHFIYILFFVFGFLTSFKGSAQVTISNTVVNSCTGSITIAVDGGVVPYMYEWSKENTSGGWDPVGINYFALDGQSSGNYRVLVTDANESTVLGEYVISAPIALTVTNILSGLVCPEDSNSGVIIVQFGNGFPPYEWSLMGSNSSFTARTGKVNPTGTPYYLSIDNIPEGDYTFDWTDDFGCSGTEEITVSAPPATELTINATADVLCFGESNGEVNISVTGGWGPDYAINIVPDGGEPESIESFTNIGDGTNYTINDLAAGTYQIYYYDKLANPPLTTTYDLDVSNYNCVKSKTFTIDTPAELISTPTGELLSCFGDTNGNITGTITGGTAPYTIKLDGTATQITGIADGGNFDFSGLSAETYDFTITDAAGCSINTQASITQPDQLITSFVSKQDVTCNAGTDGSIMVKVTGGTANYIFKVDGTVVTPISSSSENYTIGNLSAGTYNITITDQNDCTASTDITQTITEPSSLTVATSGETLTCFGDSDGNITGNISGGTAPYTISLDDRATQITVDDDGGSFDFSGLSAGTYNFTITDAKDCTTTVQETISTPLELISTPVGELLSCFGDTDGNITGTITGGTAPYRISLNGTTTAQTGIADDGSFDFSELSVGTYNFTITDAVGCIDTAQASITQPDQLITSFVSKQDVSCNAGADGNIMVSVTGGTADYIFKVDGVLVTPTLASGTNYTIGNLSAGTYNITITDQNNCTANNSVTQVITEPAEINLSLDSFQNLSCFNSGDGSITVGVTGGTLSTTQGEPNYIFTLTGPSAVMAQDTGNNTWTFDSLDAGTYTISVTDQNNCISNPAQITQKLTQPLAINFTALEQDISCNGAEDGSIDITVTGGTVPYTYAWIGPNSFSETTQDINALVPGAYTITVTDDNECTLVENYIITEPDILDLAGDLSDYNGFEVSENGLSDGSIDITVTGGTTPHSYSWTSLNGTIPVGQETQEDLTGLNAGTYTVQITDTNGCTITKTWEITEPFELLINESPASHVDVLCFGDNTGVIKVVVTQQSVGPYEYTITNILGVFVEQVTDQTTSYVFDGLFADTYTVTVTDANGNSKSLNNIIITQPESLLRISDATISNFNGFGISCNGAADGSIAITVSGGAAAYTYAWTSPNGFSATSQDISALAPGAYSITVTDANGCSTTEETYTITEPDEIIINTTLLQDVQCFENSDGKIEITITGGTGDFTYNWTKNSTPYATTKDLAGISPGEYVLIVQEAGNSQCYRTKTFPITQPDLLEIALESKIDILCHGDSTGSAQISVTGGTSPYQYSWIEASGATYNTEDLLGVPAGDYQLAVTDALGCSNTFNVILNEPDNIVLNESKTDITCFGSNDGTISIAVTGGVSPYTYIWSDLGSGPLRRDLAPGIYDVTVTDSNNCQKKMQFEIIEAPLFKIDPITTHISCFGATDGSIDLNLAGGIAPLNITWGDGNSAGLTRNNLSAGSYSVFIEDAVGCSITKNFSIIEPSEIVLDAVVMNAIDCTDPNSGSIDLQVVGGTAPFIFLWSTGSTTEDLQNIGANNYTVTVTDSRGCQEQTTVVVTRQTPLVLNLNTSIIPDCINKSVIQRNELEVLGGVAPYNISWSNGMISGAYGEFMETTQNGTVIAEVTDSLGCTEQLVFDINLFTLGEPSFNYDSFAYSSFGILSIEDPITFIDTSSGDPLNFLWSFGDGNTSTDKDPTHTYTTEGTYEVILTVQYPYGCSFTETMTINIGKGYNIVVPNAFTPNSDGLNDVIRPVYIGMMDVEMSIYNTWGALVYFEKGLELKGWDGVIKNNLGENGNYIIKVKATTFYGLVLTFNKPITLIK